MDSVRSAGNGWRTASRCLCRSPYLEACHRWPSCSVRRAHDGMMDVRSNEEQRTANH
jgi:hypothetical protein